MSDLPSRPSNPSNSSNIAPFWIFAGLAAVIAVFWPTFRDMMAIGNAEETYTHRVLAIPVFLVLVWGLRDELSRLPVRRAWWGLTGMAAAGLLWLTGDLVFIKVFTETAVIVMVPFVVLTVFGVRWLWAISFPLAFLLFAIPIRGPLVTLQVDLTAKFAYAGLLATGIPVHREGPYFELPTGNWSVAAACSGIEYLSACLMLTSLFAWTLYDSARKRALFLFGALVVAIAGNWLRAYLTILVAHLTDNRYLRNGHGTFGWLLFAVILFAYCAIGWHFRDPVKKAENKTSLLPEKPTTIPLKATALAAVVALAMLAIWPLIRHTLAGNKPLAPISIASIGARSGWTSTPRPFTDWKPSLTNPLQQQIQLFEKDGRRVGVFIGVYSHQSWTSKLVTSVNDFVEDENHQWTVVSRDTAVIPFSGKDVDIKTAVIVGSPARIYAWQWYWVSGDATGNDLRAKQSQLTAALAGKSDTAAWVSLYTPDVQAGGSVEEAQKTLRAFIDDMGGELQSALRRTTDE